MKLKLVVNSCFEGNRSLFLGYRIHLSQAASNMLHGKQAYLILLFVFPLIIISPDAVCWLISLRFKVQEVFVVCPGSVCSFTPAATLLLCKGRGVTCAKRADVAELAVAV